MTEVVNEQSMYGYPPPTTSNSQPTPQSPNGSSSSQQASSRKTLYVGNLDSRVTETMLQDFCRAYGEVASVKIISDPKFSNGIGYGFVEFEEARAADIALSSLQGRRVFDQEIKVNWAYTNNAQREDTSHHFHVFVGDLAPEVDDSTLKRAFEKFASMSDARIMWDNAAQRSRGYGFVAFKERIDAENAIMAMNGEQIAGKPVRCNWASQKSYSNTAVSSSQPSGSGSLGMVPPMYGMSGYGPMGIPQNINSWTPQLGMGSYEMIARQSSDWNTTVYAGNLTPYTTQNDLLPLFSTYGYVMELRIQADKGYAFVKMDTHQNAAVAICQLSGYPLHGRGMRCSWGNLRNTQPEQRNTPSTYAANPYIQQQQQQPYQQGQNYQQQSSQSQYPNQQYNQYQQSPQQYAPGQYQQYGQQQQSSSQYPVRNMYERQ